MNGSPTRSDHDPVEPLHTRRADRRQPGQAGVPIRAGAAGSSGRSIPGRRSARSTERLGPMFGPMVVFAAATGLRPSELFALEHGDVDRAAGVVQIRRAYANGRVKQTKTRLSRRAVPLQAIALEALDQLRPREDSPLLFPNTRGGHLDFRNFNRRHWKPVQKSSRDRAAARPLRPAPHLRHLRAPRRRAGVRPLAVHGHEHRDDRPPLRPPRSRQLPARRLAPRRARARAGRGRWVDAGPKARKAAQRHGFQASREAFAAGGGRSVDVEV